MVKICTCLMHLKVRHGGILQIVNNLEKCLAGQPCRPIKRMFLGGQFQICLLCRALIWNLETSAQLLGTYAELACLFAAQQLAALLAVHAARHPGGRAREPPRPGHARLLGLDIRGRRLLRRLAHHHPHVRLPPTHLKCLQALSEAPVQVNIIHCRPVGHRTGS